MNSLSTSNGMPKVCYSAETVEGRTHDEDVGRCSFGGWDGLVHVLCDQDRVPENSKDDDGPSPTKGTGG